MIGVLMLYAGAWAAVGVRCAFVRPGDERAHVDYAGQVGHGHLPVAGPWITPQFPELGQTTNAQHVANHHCFDTVAGPLRPAGRMGGPSGYGPARRPSGS